MIEQCQRLSRFTELKAYCHHAKDHDYMEVTEWANGEGFDINIDDKKHLSLTHGQWQALQALVAYRE